MPAHIIDDPHPAEVHQGGRRNAKPREGKPGEAHVTVEDCEEPK